MTSIVDLGDVGEFSLTLYTLAFTFLDLTVAVVFAFTLVLLLTAFGLTLPQAWQLVIFFVILLFVAISSGIISGIVLERGSFFDIVRKLPLFDILNKRSSARPLIFLLRRNTGGLLAQVGDARPGEKVGEAWIRIHMQEGPIYEGWPEFYDSKPTELYLSPACRIDEGGGGAKATKVAGPGVIIPESRIQFAVLLERRSSPCFLEFFPPKQPGN
jgi:hypothetical protein